MEPPNILLINCDDLGYGDPGCYGSTFHETPNIDRLANEGLRLTDFYMASSVSSPSRAAMLTGCYPPRVECGDFDGSVVLFPGGATGLNPTEQTIARGLSQRGYATALVGKWHCGDQPEFLPTRHGFDHYYGLPYSNDMGMMKTRPQCRTPLPLLHGESVIQEQPDLGGLTERYVEEAVHFMRSSRGRPFFLYFAHLHPHLPHLTAPVFEAASRNGPYGAAVACIDWATGALMAELKRLAIEERTLVIFTSDNGSRARGEGGSNGPLRGTKASSWEGGFRVPCLIRWPGRVPAGSVNGSIVSSIDFLPTLTALTGAPPPKRKIDGLDCSALWLGEAREGPRETFFYYSKHKLSAVRHGPWKLHVHRGLWGEDQEVAELYNLSSDIGETNNVYAQHPAVVGQLTALLDSCRAELGDDFRGLPGPERRPKGRVANPVTLTTYDPTHPYMIASYDGAAG